MKTLINIELVVTKIFFVIMVMLILLAAIGRCVGYPLIWSIEISMVLFAWISMFSIHYAHYQNRNMGIDFLSKRFPEKVKVVVDYINHLLIISFLGFGAYSGYSFSWEISGHLLPVSEISQLYLSAAVPTGCLLMIFTCIEQLIDKIKYKKALIPGEDTL